jgi:peptidyl-prolyl cis-trans isomerase SurA
MGSRLLPVSVLLPTLALAQASEVDRVVAIVQGRPLLESAVRAQLERLPPDDGPRARARALSSLIDETLIELDAAALQLEVRDAEVDRAIEQIRQRNELTEAQLEAELTRQGLTRQRYRAELRRQLLAMRWLLRKLGPERPTTPEGLEQERARLVAALRASAAIEVRP